MRVSRPGGVTLVEMLVVLVILGVLATTAGLAFSNARIESKPGKQASLNALRTRAILDEHPVQLRYGDPTLETAMLVLPDGRVIGHGVDPLTGQVTDATR